AWCCHAKALKQRRFKHDRVQRSSAGHTRIKAGGTREESCCCCARKARGIKGREGESSKINPKTEERNSKTSSQRALEALNFQSGIFGRLIHLGNVIGKIEGHLNVGPMGIVFVVAINSRL